MAGGVPQGCPLSGGLFATAMFPLIAMLETELGSSSSYCYADDVAVLIRSLDAVPRLAKILRTFSNATGLNLKPSKCQVLPLRTSTPDGTLACDEYRRRIAAIEPSWRDFEVTTVATYLGIRVGTADDDERSRFPLAKHHARVGELAGGRFAPSLTTRLYAERAMLAGALVHRPSHAPTQIRRTRRCNCDRAPLASPSPLDAR